MAELSEEAAQVLDEEAGLFDGGEVAAEHEQATEGDCVVLNILGATVINIAISEPAVMAARAIQPGVLLSVSRESAAGEFIGPAPSSNELAEYAKREPMIRFFAETASQLAVKGVAG
ncbi:hypothetical protein ACWGKQ_04275 [Streptomyces sp. NPDC054770]